MCPRITLHTECSSHTYHITSWAPTHFYTLNHLCQGWVRIIKGYMYQNLFTSMLRVWGRVRQGWKWGNLSSVINPGSAVTRYVFLCHSDKEKHKIYDFTCTDSKEKKKSLFVTSARHRKQGYFSECRHSMFTLTTIDPCYYKCTIKHIKCQRSRLPSGHGNIHGTFQECLGEHSKMILS